MWLVKGNSALVLKAGFSPLLAGFPSVVLSTISPILIVAINSTLSDQGNIAVSSVIGSNLFNICVVLGISAVLLPINITMRIIKIYIPVLVSATVLFAFLFADRQITRLEGILLLSGSVIFILSLIIIARREKINIALPFFGDSLVKGNEKWHFSASLIITGISLISIGSELLILGSLDFAKILGVGGSISGITIIAAGASIPLLVTSVVAARKMDGNMVIATVLTSSILNILLVLGIAALIRPLSAIAFSTIDLFVIVGITLFLLPFLKTNYILKRDEGIFMIGMYVIYIFYLWPK
jgi:cation:H+ antiporter